MNHLSSMQLSHHCPRQPNYRARLTLGPAQHALKADSALPIPVPFFSEVLRHSLLPLKHPCYTRGVLFMLYPGCFR